MWPNRISDIIWIQTYWHSDGILERTTFIKKVILKIFAPENVACFVHLLHKFKSISAFFIEANNMNPDQPALKETIWSGSVLFVICAKQLGEADNESHDRRD